MAAECSGGWLPHCHRPCQIVCQGVSERKGCRRRGRGEGGRQSGWWHHLRHGDANWHAVAQVAVLALVTVLAQLTVLAQVTVLAHATVLAQATVLDQAMAGCVGDSHDHKGGGQAVTDGQEGAARNLRPEGGAGDAGKAGSRERVGRSVARSSMAASRSTPWRGQGTCGGSAA
eukprot:scaffold35968_cov112-Isochrysis_galbana.AAC.2